MQWYCESRCSKLVAKCCKIVLECDRDVTKEKEVDGDAFDYFRLT
jgi:hypothetical protein